MPRAMILAAFLYSCLAVGKGFLLVAPRVTPPEPSRPKQAAQSKQVEQASTRFETAPVESGGVGTAGALSLSGAGGGGGGAGTKARLPRVPVEEEARLHAIAVVVEPELDGRNDITAAVVRIGGGDIAVPIVEAGMTVMEEEKEEEGEKVEGEEEEEKEGEKEEEEEDWGAGVVAQEKAMMMRLTVTVQKLTSDTTTVFKTKTEEEKVVATAVHEWTPMDVEGWAPIEVGEGTPMEGGEGTRMEVGQGEGGALSETKEERHRDDDDDDAGSLYGVSVNDLTEHLAKVADATEVQNGQQLSGKVFAAAVDVVCCEITSRAFPDQRPAEPGMSSDGAALVIIGSRSFEIPSSKRWASALGAHGGGDGAGLEVASRFDEETVPEPCRSSDGAAEVIIGSRSFKTPSSTRWASALRAYGSDGGVGFEVAASSVNVGVDNDAAMGSSWDDEEFAVIKARKESKTKRFANLRRLFRRRAW